MALQKTVCPAKGGNIFKSNYGFEIRGWGRTTNLPAVLLTQSQSIDKTL
jgi:hypothetical protein